MEGLLLWQLLSLLLLSVTADTSIPHLGWQEVAGEIIHRCPNLEAAPSMALGVKSQHPCITPAVCNLALMEHHLI